MATKKISELEAITQVDDNDVLVIVDASEGTTNKITRAQLLIGSGNSVDLELNTETYQLTLELKNSAGTVLSTAAVDLPSENSITKIEYQNEVLKLTKQSGEVSEVDISGILTNLKLVIGIENSTYDREKVYTLGDIVIQDEKIYKCIAEDTTGYFNEEDWQEISVYQYQKIQDEKIEKNYKEINNLKEEVEEEKENDIVSSATGISIDINDSAAAKNRSIRLIGNTTQESTTGKNLLNVPESFSFKVKVQPIELPAGTYHITCGKVTKGGTENPSISIGGTSRLLTTNADLTATLSEAITQVIFYSNGYAYADSQNVTSTVENLMISVDGGDYEPYTGGQASPNPDYPQEIKNTGDNVNLFDKDNANILNTAMDANGLGANSPSTYRTVYIACKPSTTYTISRLFDNTKNRFAVAYTETEPTYNMQVEGLISYQEKSILTITTGANALYLLAYIWIAGGTLTAQEILDTLKIEQGTKATPYSPYGCGNVNEKVQNKNFLKIENITASTNTTVTNGVVKQTTADTSTTFSWKFNCYNDNTFVKQLSTVYKNTTGILEKTFTKDSTFNNIIFGLNGSQRDTLAKINLSNLPDGDYVLSFNITNMTQGSISWEDIQAEQGSTATPYQPHEEQNILFPLAQGQKLMQGDYLADDGVHHVSGEIAFDGSNDENWIYVSTYAYFYITITGFKSIDFCDYYSKETGETLTNNHFRFNPNNGNFYIKDERFTSASSFKTELATNDVIGQGELSQEVIDPYTSEQQQVWEQIKALRTYKPVTHISSEDETPATVELKYVVDTKTYIDNKIETLKNAVISLGGNV